MGDLLIRLLGVSCFLWAALYTKAREERAFIKGLKAWLVGSPQNFPGSNGTCLRGPERALLMGLGLAPKFLFRIVPLRRGGVTG